MIPNFITECGASHLVTDFSPLREIRSCRDEVVKRTSEEVVKMVLSSFQVPPPGKGSLYNRLFLMGTEAVIGLALAPEYTFLAYLFFSCGNHFKGLHDCTSVAKNTYSAVAIFRDCTIVIN
ncbi:unnamed protein product [Brassica oleracea var. botrytis]|uniref:Uncharacterized protein n=1 Tax=Brassica oleracea TaxID=3712 RepID=A0A3P6EW11_BRAOL|nr:unnamed protein product [Brassica oleracea]